MGPALFVIAIMGCGESDASCTTVRTLEARYETRAACIAATQDAVAGNADIDYPVVVAQCTPAGASARVKAGEVRTPAGGTVRAEASPIRS
ncbi:MAG TPA: hypothetical protein VHM92_12030 [Allosphingosinicella sp.]|nr:hypothetical protein [Allosphingosinicella sp.]